MRKADGVLWHANVGHKGEPDTLHMKLIWIVQLKIIFIAHEGERLCMDVDAIYILLGIQFGILPRCMAIEAVYNPVIGPKKWAHTKYRKGKKERNNSNNNKQSIWNGSTTKYT